jgi:hypothetical protein
VWSGRGLSRRLLKFRVLEWKRFSRLRKDIVHNKWRGYNLGMGNR